jgi:hypothetical protein
MIRSAEFSTAVYFILCTGYDGLAQQRSHRVRTQPLGPSRSRRHLLLLKNVLISPRWLPANGRPPPCPRLLPLPAMACPAAPPRDQGPSRGGSVGREGLSSGRSPLSSVADGAGAPAHHSAEQPYRPLGGAVRRGAVALTGICRGVWRLASRSPEAPGGW